MTPNLPTLPAGWEWKKLGDIADIVGGGTPKTEIKQYWNGDIIWLSPTDLGEVGSIQKVNNSAKKISQLGLEKSSAKLLPIGTVLFSSRASIGKIGITEVELSTNQGFTNFICKPLIYNHYLAYAFKHFRQDIEDLSNSTTFKEVNKSSFKEFAIPLPPLDEQKRLVSLLDTLFAKIDRSIELLSENITAADVLLPSALNTVFGELEEKWESKLLENLIKISSGNYFNANEYSDEGVRLFKINNVTFGSTSWENIDYLPLEYIEKHPELVLKNKDLVMALNRPLLNRKLKITFIKETDSPSILYQRVGKIIPKDQNTLLKEYIFWCFNSPIFIDEFEGKLLGSDQPYINNKNLYSIKIPFPPLDIQTQTVAYLDSIRTKVEILKQVQNDKITHLKALKASILDRAFKGEL